MFRFVERLIVSGLARVALPPHRSLREQLLQRGQFIRRSKIVEIREKIILASQN
jgi:hypothetical protein